MPHHILHKLSQRVTAVDHHAKGADRLPVLREELVDGRAGFFPAARQRHAHMKPKRRADGGWPGGRQGAAAWRHTRGVA
eukprot:6967494-Prymnesium_polylepis.1